MRLIVNADDFGLTSGVNRAIAELHSAGVLTSASLMSRAAATNEAVDMANNRPSLGVGCHVVLVDGQPVLSPRQDIPRLADPVTGQFRSSLGEFARWLYTDRSSRFSADEIEAEAAAQIRLLQDRGVRLTHIDTHKHTHVFPAVLRPVLRAAHKAGIRAVRNPFEPLWSVRATPRAPWLRRTGINFLRRFLYPGFQRAIAEEEFVTTDGTISLSATGTLNAETLTSLFADVPEGTWELVTHPGYWDEDLAQVKTRLKQTRDTERITLPMLKQIPGIEFISFRNLTESGIP